MAAEKYRRVQAGKLVRSITVVQENKKREPVEVRAFVQSKETYTPIEVVVNSREQMLELLSAAMSELRAFERKYAVLSQLSPVFEAIKRVSAREATDARPTI